MVWHGTALHRTASQRFASHRRHYQIPSHQDHPTSIPPHPKYNPIQPHGIATYCRRYLIPPNRTQSHRVSSRSPRHRQRPTSEQRNTEPSSNADKQPAITDPPHPSLKKSNPMASQRIASDPIPSNSIQSHGIATYCRRYPIPPIRIPSHQIHTASLPIPSFRGLE